MSKSVPDRLLNHPYAQKAAQQVKRHRKVLYAFLALFILFGLVGYFWLPGFAKGKAEAMLSELLHRPVTVERVSVNPYTLEATIHGFRIGEREGTNLALIGRTISQVGFVSDIRFGARPLEKLLLGVSVGATDQPNRGDVGVKLGTEFEILAGENISVLLRGSWQGRSTKHGGLGAGGGLGFYW